jgi:hypothetical protein
MKRLTVILFAVVLGFALLSSCYYPYWGYYPYYWGWPYYPPGATQAPPVYSKSEQRQPYYWYYCQNPQGYYPNVESCPGGWIPVVPNVGPPN